MAPSTRPPLARRALAALRSLRPSSVVAVTLALVLGSATVADAANGGSFLLGKANAETATASLTNTTGTPLKLSAPAGKAPLAVTQNTMVNNLNAQYLGGFTSTELRTFASGTASAPGTDTPVGASGAFVASTGPLINGAYYITATALIDVAAGDNHAACYLLRSSDGLVLNKGGSSGEGFAQAAETAVLVVSAGDSVSEECFTGGDNGSVVDDAGIVAIRGG